MIELRHSDIVSQTPLTIWNRVMKSYLVFLGSDRASHDIQGKFETIHYKFSENLFAVGSSAQTPAELCERIGIGATCPGVVVAMNQFYSHFDKALWQKLDAWSAK